MDKATLKIVKSWGLGLLFAGVLALGVWSRWSRVTAQPEPGEESWLLPYWPIFAACAALIPVLLLATTAFTFDFSKPVLAALRMRLRLLLILWVAAAAGTVTLLESRLAAGLRLPPPVLLGIGLAVVVVMAQFVWSQIEGHALDKRLQARGEAVPQIEPVSLRQLVQGKWIQVEAGLLFREGDRLRLVGDLLNVQLDPNAIRRDIIPGTASALLGRKGLLLSLTLPDGSVEETRVCKHGAWNPLREEEDAAEIALRLSA